MKAAALYARVSTKDKGQDTANQLLQLRERRNVQSHSRSAWPKLLKPCSSTSVDRSIVGQKA